MVRHTIVFNIREDATHEECLAIIGKGKEMLSQIPGVLNVAHGVAVAEQPRYRYTFMIDFENEDVIPYYKHHPIHVEYADTWFRPLAVDRVTTDYRMEP